MEQGREAGVDQSGRAMASPIEQLPQTRQHGLCHVHILTPILKGRRICVLYNMYNSILCTSVYDKDTDTGEAKQHKPSPKAVSCLYMYMYCTCTYVYTAAPKKVLTCYNVHVPINCKRSIFPKHTLCKVRTPNISLLPHTPLWHYIALTMYMYVYVYDEDSDIGETQSKVTQTEPKG